MPSYDVVLDAIGSPEQLTLNTTCRRVKLKQKNSDAATLLAFNVYVPDSGTAAEYTKAGDTWSIEFPKLITKGTKFAQAETLSSSDTFSQIEDK